MSDGSTFKMIKLVGTSKKSIEDAVKTALSKAGESVRGQSWAHVVDLRVNLAEDGSVEEWQTTIEAGFKIE